MGRKIRIAELKAHLSANLRAVQRGQRITVMSRDIPVAEIIPIERPREKLVITPAQYPPSTLKTRHVDLGVDLVKLLLEDRAKR